jgi:hypothetical protein
MQYHTLRHNRRNATVPAIFVLDSEATITYPDKDTQIQTLRVGVCLRIIPATKDRSEHREYFVFREASALWKWITEKVRRKETNLLIAHNASYDVRLCNISLLVSQFGWESVLRCIDDPPFILKFRKPEENGRYTYLTLLSTTNFVKAPLEDIGKSIGIPKLSVDFETTSDDELITYCKRDVDILATWFLKYINWLKTNDLGKLCYSAPSQAMHAYRHRFMPRTLHLHNDEEIKAFERKAYYGGRCECFFIGQTKETPLYQLDVNSMYPYVMNTYGYPTKLLKVREEIDVSELEKLLAHYCLVAQVRVTTDEPCYPYRTRETLLFPCGSFDTYLSTPELAYGCARGYIDRVYRVAIYSRAKVFEQYVDWFYTYRLKMKEEGRKLEDGFAKLMMNSLYGKFGQHDDAWTVKDMCSPHVFLQDEYFYYDEDRWIKIRALFGVIEERTGFREPQNNAPAIAAHVTAYARMYLWHLITQAGIDNVYYCDTDSLIVNEAGYLQLQQYLGEIELGKLKLEKVHNNLVILGPKSYYSNVVVRRKGIRKDAEKLNETTFRQWHWHGFLWGVRNGVLDKVILTRVVKQCSREYRKGTVQPDGRVLPFRL